MDLERRGVEFNMTHAGSGSFEALLWADDGTFVGLLADGLGNYTAEKAIVLNDDSEASAGIHWLSVYADGNWTITITGK